MWTKLLIGEEVGLNELCLWKRDSNTFQLLETLKTLALQQVEKNEEKCDVYSIREKKTMLMRPVLSSLRVFSLGENWGRQWFVDLFKGKRLACGRGRGHT